MKSTHAQECGSENHGAYAFRKGSFRSFPGTSRSSTSVPELKERKIDGDNITFVEALDMSGDEVRIVYAGKIDGDNIEFTRKV